MSEQQKPLLEMTDAELADELESGVGNSMYFAHNDWVCSTADGLKAERERKVLAEVIRRLEARDAATFWDLWSGGLPAIDSHDVADCLAGLAKQMKQGPKMVAQTATGQDGCKIVDLHAVTGDRGGLTMFLWHEQGFTHAEFRLIAPDTRREEG